MPRRIARRLSLSLVLPLAVAGPSTVTGGSPPERTAAPVARPLTPPSSDARDRVERLRQDVAARFDRLDRDGDGAISEADAGGARWFRQARARLDRDGDGAIDRSEIAPPTGERPDATLESDLPPMPQLTRHLDVPYGDGTEPGVDLRRLDLYVPAGSPPAADALPDTTLRPVVIMIHGGGWRIGDKRNPNVVGAKMRHFVANGSIYVSINHRLSTPGPDGPVVRHPVHVQDCADAIGWVHRSIAEYGGDPNQLHLIGHSAGAHLVSLVTADPRWLESADVPRSVVRTAVLLDTAAIDIPGHLDRSPRSRDLYVNAFGEDASVWRQASPITHVGQASDVVHPRTLLLINGRRRGVPADAAALAGALTAAGAPSMVMDTGTRSHAAINAEVGMRGDPMITFIDRLHRGEDPRTFPRRAPERGSPVVPAPIPLPVPVPVPVPLPVPVPVPVSAPVPASAPTDSPEPAPRSRDHVAPHSGH